MFCLFTSGSQGSSQTCTPAQAYPSKLIYVASSMHARPPTIYLGLHSTSPCSVDWRGAVAPFWNTLTCNDTTICRAYPRLLLQAAIYIVIDIAFNNTWRHKGYKSYDSLVDNTACNTFTTRCRYAILQRSQKWHTAWASTPGIMEALPPIS